RVPVFCFCHTPLKVVYDPFTRARYSAQSPSLAMRLAIDLYTRVDRWGWRYYRRVFCNSREVASRVLNAHLIHPDFVEVLYPGVDLHQFDPQGPQEAFFLLPGRIARTKNIELGIDAFLQFKRNNHAAKAFKLVIAGMVDQKSQPYLRQMQQRAQGCSDIHFVISPSDDELRDLYRRCFASLFTALNEDWGIVVLEAMASGKPVIAVNRGGPTESIVHGETGLLCPAEPSAFALEMADLIADPVRALAMGQGGRQRAVTFTWEPFVRRIDDYVDSLAGKTDLTIAVR
ncbi:MAG TPA: glycosyltransferase, partial [Chloroflexota bacterium]|nr:glycosyltransferase [Chloroflexota bacterium]